ncbi:hypothetical protein ALC57_10490, partial [Trachymyrmex cornetzi]
QDFSRSGRQKDECRARSDDYIIHRAIGCKTLPCEEKKNIEGEKEKENRRVKGWENRYIEQRTR